MLLILARTPKTAIPLTLSVHTPILAFGNFRLALPVV